MNGKNYDTLYWAAKIKEAQGDLKKARKYACEALKSHAVSSVINGLSMTFWEVGLNNIIIIKEKKKEKPQGP